MRRIFSNVSFNAHQRRSRPTGSGLIEHPVPVSRPTAPPAEPVTQRESPLQTFTVDLSVAGEVTRPATGNFLRYNKSAAGSDNVSIQLRNGASDSSHAAVTLYPGQRIRGRTFTHLKITVPAGLTGTAEFVYTTNPAGDDVSDVL